MILIIWKGHIPDFVMKTGLFISFFFELTENVHSCDMYRYLDMKWPIAGYEILVVSHSPSGLLQNVDKTIDFNVGSMNMKIILRFLKAFLWYTISVTIH